MIYQALYDLAITALSAVQLSPFFFCMSGRFFYSSRRLRGLAALYTVLFLSILSHGMAYKNRPLQLIVSTLAIGIVGFVTDWLVFARRKNERN
jgi:hypothetical protein